MVTSSFINVLLFKPPFHRTYNFPKSRQLELTTSRGSKIAATYIRRRGANVTVLFSHGNAEDLNTCYWWLQKMSKDLDVNVMSYDYTGYGSSDGEPSEEDCYADIEAAWSYLMQEKKLNPEQVVLYGRSLGSGPSCYLASNKPTVAGLILQSPFTSVFRVVLKDLPFTVMGDKFPNIDRISSIQCPVLIVHGEDDDVVPLEHGKALLELTPCKADPLFIKGAGHNSFGCQVEALLLKKLNGFLDYHILTRRLWMRPSTK